MRRLPPYRATIRDAAMRKADRPNANRIWRQLGIKSKQRNTTIFQQLSLSQFLVLPHPPISKTGYQHKDLFIKATFVQMATISNNVLTVGRPSKAAATTAVCSVTGKGRNSTAVVLPLDNAPVTIESFCSTQPMRQNRVHVHQQFEKAKYWGGDGRQGPMPRYTVYR
ncbi:hypothetical protein GLAREA_09695 [Glarea lozoyensis ATCC 20868]|uniref:Uncharacterized protein n=1 Tax=Glarea lozoyensis (strain ATCC 20868 / MF5171) TaxID=1116229 RepID=S3CU74_GLAL2|nr:uncharacterized protein GLAREA_09695 [Glarea lozoyensis ATCC 20868]EPE28574.1 hypothetical protein GLAREA_09695 [Glarea lozoyensis ATCC 20868]